MTRKKTWILVADAGRARVLERLGRDGTPTLVSDLAHPMAKTSDVARDSLPRTFDSVGKGRHAIQPKSDPHRADKAAFAGDLAAMLDDAVQAKSFDELIIIAPAQMVGDLRDALSDHVKAVLRKEVLLDLAHAPIGEIADRLKKLSAA
jgi:protein required for attachment to host cells